MSYEALKFGNFGWDMPAWIDLADGSPLRPCKVRDLSDHSATLVPSGMGPAPNHFLLRLTPTGSLVRKCAVVTRGEADLRVQFF